MLLSRAGPASCLCCHAFPLPLRGSFLKCSVWLLPPLFLDKSPENWIVRISEGRWLFSLCCWDYRRPWHYWVALKYRTCLLTELINVSFLRQLYGSIHTDICFFLCVSWCFIMPGVSPVLHCFCSLTIIGALMSFVTSNQRRGKESSSISSTYSFWEWLTDLLCWSALVQK